MGLSSMPAVTELSEGLSLVPCIVISLSFTRADVSLKPVDEWQLKEGLTAFFKKRLGLAISDGDLVVHREKNYYKKRRDEPIADGVLHLWGGEGSRVREGGDLGTYVLNNVNGVELNVGGLKLKCLAVIKETNNYEAVKKSWEAVFGPHRGGVSPAGPTTLTLKGVPSRWFAEPRVSSKASVLVTHTIFSRFGEIRNLEVLGNEDLGKNSKEMGSIASALQCQVWVQYDSHANFCNALEALCGRAMQKEGSNFRAAYVVDWDKENYFSILNVRRRKFEKERLEQQERAEAERAQKQEFEARQAELVQAEQERLKTEQIAAALREEEERQQQLIEQAQKLEEEAQMRVPESGSTSSEEDGLIKDERQESSDEDLQENGREMEEHTSEEEKFSVQDRERERYMSKIKRERISEVREKRRYMSDDEEGLLSQEREKRRFISDDEEETPSPQVRDKGRNLPKGKKLKRSAHVGDKRRGTSEDEEEHLLQGREKRRDTSEDEEEEHLVRWREKRRYISEDEEEHLLQGREKRRYISEDEEDHHLLQLRQKRQYTSEDVEERHPLQVREERLYMSEEEEKDSQGGFDHRKPERALSSSMERWQPEEEVDYHSKLEAPIHRQQAVYEPVKDGRIAIVEKSYNSEEDSLEENNQGVAKDVKRIEELQQGGSGDFEVERWVLEVAHSVASLSASEILLHPTRSNHDGRMARNENPGRRLRSVVLISS